MWPEREAVLVRLARLTARERAVLHLDCQGRTTQQTAEELRIGERTVYDHMRRIYEKLDLLDERDNLRQRKLVFFCLRLPELEQASVPSPPEPAEATEPPPPSPAEAAGFERDRTAIVRWRRGELVPLDPHRTTAEEEPEEHVPAAAWPLAARPPATLHRARPEQGRPSWAALVLVAVLAALLGSALTAVLLARRSPLPLPPTPTAALLAVGTTQAPPTPAAGELTATSAVALLVPATPTATATPAPTATAAASATSGQRPVPAGPAPASTVIVTVDPAATPLDLAGTVASDRPGTPLTLGHSVSSVLDPTTKPQDVYSLQLPAGERFRPVVQASSTRFTVTLAPASGHGAATLCDGLMLTFTCDQSFPIASGGSYRLVVAAINESVRYTLQPATLPIAVPPGVADLVGRVASNIPGTPLGLGQPVLSVVDAGTKPFDVYTLALRAGQTLHVQASGVPAREEVLLLPPGAAPFTGSPPSLTGTELCIAVINLGRCDATTPIATGGAYTLIVETDAPGVQYTLQASAQ